MPIPRLRIAAAIVVAALAWYNGVDVVPGSYDEALASTAQPENDFSLSDFLEGPDKVIRLKRADGKAISEDEEAKLLPLLESIELVLDLGGADDATVKAALLAGSLSHDDAIEERLKTRTPESISPRMVEAARKRAPEIVREKLSAMKELKIFSDAEVDAIKSRADVVRLIEQMGATVGIMRHIFRFTLAMMMLVCPNGVSESPTAAMAIEVFLIFMPYGHPVTTAGRHFEGTGKMTWLGLRRFDLGLFQLLHIALLTGAQNLALLVHKQRPNFLRLKLLLSLLSAVFFSFMAVRLYTSGAHSFEDASVECAAEFNYEVAAVMHEIYLAFLAWDVVRSAAFILSTKFADVWTAYAMSPQSRWFWFLALYFSPYEDVALPMLMSCVRQVLEDVHALFGRKDVILGPATTLVELAHWFITVSSGCHWPIVLWLRVPLLAEGAAAFLSNLKLILTTSSGSWVSETAVVREVTVYVPVGDDLGNKATLGSFFHFFLAGARSGQGDAPQSLGQGIPGVWKSVKTKMRMDLEPMSLGSNPKGAMRDVYHCVDEDQNVVKLLKDTWPLGEAMHGLPNDGKLVFKKYRDSLDDVIYYRDCYMQKVAADYSEAFSQQLARSQAKAAIHYAPACVIKTKDGKTYGCEFFLRGSYQKWNANSCWPDVILTEDPTPTAFCHFTHDLTDGKRLVCDIQGVEGSLNVSRFGIKAPRENWYMLTDPQIHTDEPNNEIRMNQGDFGVGDMGPEGISNFFKGHRCGPACHALGLTHPFSEIVQKEIDQGIVGGIYESFRFKMIMLVAILVIWVIWAAWHVSQLSEASPEL